MDKSTGVGVLDKTVALLDAIAREPRTLAGLVEATGLPRPTAHRLAHALELHGLLDKDPEGQYRVGLRLQQWAAQADPLLDEARSLVRDLVAQTGASAQVYVRRGDQRLCLASAEPATGLRDMVPTGSLLPLTAGSGAQVLLAWEPAAERSRFTGGHVTAALLATVRKRGWAHSVGQREPGVASISAPVRAGDGDVMAAVSISGPAERLGSAPVELVDAMLDGATRLGLVAHAIRSPARRQGT